VHAFIEPGESRRSVAATGAKPPITVLFLTKHMKIGGGEYVVRAIIDGLDRRQFRPILACLTEEGSFGRQLRERGVTVLADLLRHKVDVLVLWRLRQLILRERVNVVYLVDYRDVMLWGALIGRLCGVRTILATHSTDWWGSGRSPTLIGKRLLSWHSAIVSIADFQKRHLVAEEGVREARIAMIPNGIDARRYGRDGAREQCRARLDIPAAAFVVGTVAVLRPEKNIVMLFAALQRMMREGMNIHVVIVGDGEQRTELEQASRGMDMRANVTFLGYHHDPAAVLPAFDVFSLTSKIEVMPITILEAMASGLPVVATRVGGVPEIVLDGETGYLVASDDVEALASRLSELAAAPQLRRRMGMKGRDRVSALYGYGAMIARTEALLRSAVTMPRQPTGAA